MRVQLNSFITNLLSGSLSYLLMIGSKFKFQETSANQIWKSNIGRSHNSNKFAHKRFTIPTIVRQALNLFWVSVASTQMETCCGQNSEVYFHEASSIMYDRMTQSKCNIENDHFWTTTTTDRIFFGYEN